MNKKEIIANLRDIRLERIIISKGNAFSYSAFNNKKGRVPELLCCFQILRKKRSLI